jgi:hypothetical protein
LVSRLKFCAARSPAEVTMFQPARPPLMWSSEVNQRARLYGSLKPVDAVAISPMWLVTPASGEQRDRLVDAGRGVPDVTEQCRVGPRVPSR